MFCCERKSDQSPVRPTPVDFLSWFGSRCCRLKMRMFRKVKVKISWKVKVEKDKSESGTFCQSILPEQGAGVADNDKAVKESESENKNAKT